METTRGSSVKCRFGDQKTNQNKVELSHVPSVGYNSKFTTLTTKFFHFTLRCFVEETNETL